MFFTNIARILAWLMVILGVSRIVVAVGAINSDNPAFFTARYFGSKTTGEVIDQAFIIIVSGLVIGVLTDISKSIAKTKN